MSNSQPKNRSQKPTLANIAKGKPSHGAPPSPSVAAEQAMDRHLEALGLWRKPVAKDGSCLFRVIAEEVYNSQSVHAAVRKDCIKFMRDNPDMFRPFVSGPFDHYLFRMQNLKEWGGQLEIVALSQLYGVDFIMYQDVNSEPASLTNNNYSKVISLCYLNGNHYDVVYPKRFKDSASFVQSLLNEILERAMTQCCQKSPNVSIPVKRSQQCAYRNVELEVYNESKREQQSTDHRLASKLQLQAKDECLVVIRSTKLDDVSYHRACIEEVMQEGDSYKVFVEELQDSVVVQFDDIDLVPDNSYQDLSGYYRKADGKDDNYKMQGGRKRRNRVKGNHGKGRHESQGEYRQETRDQRLQGNGEKGNNRNRRNDWKRNQGGIGNATNQARSPQNPPAKSKETEVVNSDQPNAEIASNQPSKATVNAGVSILHSQKEKGETSRDFWGRFSMNTTKSNEEKSANIKTNNDSTDLNVDVVINKTGDGGKDDASAHGTSETTRADDNQNSNPINVTESSKSSSAEPIIEANLTVHPDSEGLDYCPEQNDLTANAPREIKPNLEALNINKDDISPANAAEFECLPTDLNPEALHSSHSNGGCNDSKTSTNTKDSSHPRTKMTNPPTRILKRNSSTQSAVNDIKEDNSTDSSPRCPPENDISNENLEKREKKVSFAEDIKEFTPTLTGASATDEACLTGAMNGMDCQPTPQEQDAQQIVLQTVFTDQLALPSSMMPRVPPNQQIHGLYLPCGYFTFSNDPEGKDLPTNVKMLQYFYNCGLQYCILERQQQQFQQQQQNQLQQMHMSGQFMNTITSTTAAHPMMPSNYGYNRPDERSHMFGGNMYGSAYCNDGTEYYSQPTHQAVLNNHNWKPMQQNSDGRLPKDMQGRNKKGIRTKHYAT